MVRQLFEAGILQSGFWHQFAMTAHSPVGMNPEKYKVIKQTNSVGSFANNDIVHTDPTGADHDSFSFGLKKSLLNFMHGACLDHPLQKWFDFKVPKTTVPSDYIIQAIQEESFISNQPSSKIVFTGNQPAVEIYTKSKKGSQWEMCSLTFQGKRETLTIKVDKEQGEWLATMLGQLKIEAVKSFTLQEVKMNYEAAGLEDFELFWDNKPVNTLYKMGLLHL
jgi:hypothetical protein